MRQDFLSSGGGRVPYSLLKIIMKMGLVAAVIFLVYVMSGFGVSDASGGGGEANGRGQALRRPCGVGLGLQHGLRALCRA